MTSAPAGSLLPPAPDAAPQAPILVTGATGFLGRHLLNTLHEARLPVRALVRGSVIPDFLHALGTEVAGGDIRDPDAVAAAVQGCRGVIHAAAITGWVADKRLYEAVNYEGTRNVLGVARTAELERIVHVSSVVTVGEHAGEVATEATTHRGSFLREYERTKFMAEETALAAARSGLPVVVVNPTGIIGPNLGGLTRQVLGAYVRRRLPSAPDPRNRINFVHVRDVTNGILSAYVRGRNGERYILGGDDLTLGKMFQTCEDLTGIPAPTRALPYPVSWCVAFASEVAARVTGRAPVLTRDLLRVARHGMRADSSRARRELGYTPRSARDALRETLDWLQTCRD